MTVAEGLAFSIFSACAFGSMYVPMKGCQISDGVRFQLSMCTAILCVGLAVATLGGNLDLAVEALPMLGGVLNGAANFLLLRLVSVLGMGVGYSLFHFAGIPTSYLISRLGIFGVPRAGDGVSDIGAGLVAVSFVALASVRGSDIRIDCGASESQLTSPIAATESSMMEDHEVADSRAHARKCVGVLLALASGMISAMSNVPATLWNLEHKARPLGPVLPMFFGTWLASVALAVLTGLSRGVSCAPTPIGPALVCGVIWGMGYTAFVLGVALAGFESGVVVGSIGSTIISGLISVLVYKEVSGYKARALFFAAAAMQAVGVVMMARPDPLE